MAAKKGRRISRGERRKGNDGGSKNQHYLARYSCEILMVKHKFDDLTGEGFEITQILLQNIVDNFNIHLPVQVDQAIAELDHLPKDWQEILVDNPLLSQDLKRFSIALRGPEALTGNDVIAHINTAFNRNLK